MNDERPIEKLLRRYAQKRGDEAGAPPELHPATRRLLQGEVARQYPKPAPENKPSAADFFFVLTRRWVYAVSVFVVLGLAAAMLLPALSKSKSRTMLAQKGASEEVLLRENITPVAAPAPAMPPTKAQPVLAVAEDRRNQPAPAPSGGGNFYRSQDEPTTLNYSVTNGLVVGALGRFTDAKADTEAPLRAEEAKQVSLGMRLDSAAPATRTLTVQPPTPAAGEVKPLDSLALKGNEGAGRAGASVAADGLAEIRQPTPPPAAVAASSVLTTSLSDKTFVARGGGAEKDTGQLYSQSFANVAPEQLRAKAAKVKTETPIVPVLANFQVQNVGNEVRVIDSDGSTYRGVVSWEAASQAGVATGKEATANFESADLRRAPVATSALVANQQAAQNYLWRVEGTNRTLNQNVVFTWNFLETTNTLAASEAKAISDALNQDASKLPSQFPMRLQNSIINGRAQLGPTQQIEVNAVPVKP